MSQQRVDYLDYVRVLACVLVLIIHSPMPMGGVSDIWVSFYNYFSAPCIGLFFMVSGALLFPVRLSLGDFLKKRLPKIIYPLFIWSIFYLVVKLIYKEMNMEQLPLALLQGLFIPVGHGVLWFLYTLIGLYFSAPILSKWIDRATKQELEYFLLLWSITLCLPYFQVESSLFSSFSGYMGYMVLGYYLNKYPITIAIWKLLGITIVVAFVLPGLFYLKVLNGVDNAELYGYLTINVAWLCVLYFTLIQRLNLNRRKWIVDLSVMSFGIYLLHIFIMRRIVWVGMDALSINIPTIFEIPLIAFITLIISYIVIKLISQAKLSKYIIGV